MNQKLKTWFSEHGMTDHGNYAYGVFQSFETNFSYQATNQQAPFHFHLSCYTTDEQKRAIYQQMANAQIKFFRYEFSSYGFNFVLNDMTLGSLLKRLDDVLQKICEILQQNGALGIGYCPVCGKELDFSDSKKCNIEGFTVSIDNDCVENINSVIKQENRDFEDAPNNYLRGFAGALIGGLAGAAVAVLLYMVGFFAGISAFISFSLGSFLYKKFGGKANKTMVVIVSVTTFAMMALSIVGIYLVAAGIAASEANLTMNAFEAFSYCMKNSEEFATGFYIDLLMMLVFAAIGCGVEIRKLANSVKRQDTI